MPRISITCVNCSKVFIAASIKARPDRKYCSYNCYWTRHSATYDEFFWPRVVKGPSEDACWLWGGAVSINTGYGEVYDPYSRRTVGAHRVAFESVKGKTDLIIRHTCDVKLCCNPKHLIPGTHADNARDAIERGLYLKGDAHPLRINPSLAKRGEENGNAKITVGVVRAIRLFHAYGYSAARLARGFGISTTLAKNIVRRKTWKHVI